MKKLMILMAVLILGIGQAFAKDSYTIDRSKLPKEARTFLSTHFPKAEIRMIKIDKPLLQNPDYEVKFTNGQSVEFDRYGKWKEVDCESQRVPDAIIPKPVLKYINRNYSSAFITQIDKDSKGYDVELSNGIELKFDLSGNFRSVDYDD